MLPVRAGGAAGSPSDPSPSPSPSAAAEETDEAGESASRSVSSERSAVGVEERTQQRISRGPLACVHCTVAPAAQSQAGRRGGRTDALCASKADPQEQEMGGKHNT